MIKIEADDEEIFIECGEIMTIGGLEYMAVSTERRGGGGKTIATLQRYLGKQELDGAAGRAARYMASHLDTWTVRGLRNAIMDKD